MFWNIIVLFAIAIYLAILILGFTVLRANPEKNSHRFFFIFSIFFTAWLVANFMGIWLPVEGPAVWFLYFDFILAPFFTLYLFFFLLSFPIQKISLPKKTIALLHIPSLVCALLVVMDLVITNGHKEGYLLHFTEGPLFVLYVAVIALHVFGGIGYAIASHAKQDGLQKNQTRMVLVGFALLFSILFVGNIFLQKMVGAKLFLLFNLCSVILPICITGAILKHRLMGLKTIYRSYMVQILLFAFVGVYSGFVVWCVPMIAQTLGISAVSVIGGASIIFLSLFRYFEKKIKALSYGVFSNKLSFQKLFDEITTAVSKKQTKKEKLNLFIEKIELLIGVKPVIIFFTESNTCEYYGQDNPKLHQSSIDELCNKSHMARRTIIRDEYKFSSYIPGGEKETLFSLLKREKIQALIPFLEQTDVDEIPTLHGVIMLPDRHSNESLREEIRLLEMLAPQLMSEL